MQRKVNVVNINKELLYSYFLHFRTKKEMDEACKKIQELSESGYYGMIYHIPIIGSEYKLGFTELLKTIGVVNDDRFNRLG